MQAERVRPDCDLADFWRVYDASVEAIHAGLLQLVEAHPELRSALHANAVHERPDAAARHRAAMRQASEGDWSAHDLELAAVGAQFAERGVAFEAWLELSAAFQAQMTSKLVAAYAHDPARLERALNGLHAFTHRALRTLGGAYIEAKEMALAERSQLFFECSPLPMWVFDDVTLQFLAINDAAVHQYGYSREEFLRMTLREIRPAENVPAMEKSLASRRPHGEAETFQHKKKDGTIIDVAISARSIVFAGRPARLVLAKDVTEQQRLERQLRQSQKMDAVGQLAGGIAHDFNNLLTAIISFSNYAAETLPAEHPARADIEEVIGAGKRAAALTRQLLTFSRKEMVAPRVLDLNEIAASTARMLERLVGEDVTMRTSFAPDLAPVLAHRGHIEQVLLNLVVNARDAMPQGGTLVIETANVELDEEAVRGHLGLQPGRYAMLAVSDTGVGMDEALQARIFEPFFTTKPAGQGSGLGLSTVFGIAKQWHGDISVYSAPGKGTTFKLYLPHVRPRPASTATEIVVGGGNETVLLVEDDRAVRAVAQRALAAAGYRVLEAADPEEALSVARSASSRIELLVTDVVMPRLNGRQLADELLRELPSLKVLFMSGFTGGALQHQGVVDGGTNYIQKPFTPSSLLAKVRAVLDATT